MIGSTILLAPEHAEAIAELTGCSCVLVDYDDAGRAGAALVRHDG